MQQKNGRKKKVCTGAKKQITNRLLTFVFLFAQCMLALGQQSKSLHTLDQIHLISLCFYAQISLEGEQEPAQKKARKNLEEGRRDSWKKRDLSLEDGLTLSVCHMRTQWHNDEHCIE